MEELDALLENTIAQAKEIQRVDDPERCLRELLEPVRVLFAKQLAVARTETKDRRKVSNTSAQKEDGLKSSSPVQNYLSDAAQKLQALVLRAPNSNQARSNASSASESGGDDKEDGLSHSQHRPSKIVAPSWVESASAKLQALVRGNNGAERDALVEIAKNRAQQHWSDAAIRIQALVRGKHQRQSLSRQHSLLLQGTKVMKKYVLKQDRFPNCHVLDTLDGDIAPNFRRLEGTPLYGSAQPSLEGMRMILNRVAEDGYSKVVWINLREEAVIYVDGMPFTARRSAKLNENDLVPGITGHKAQVLEMAMKNSLQEQLAESQNHFEYWHEVALHENELVVSIVEPEKVATLSEVYEMGSVVHANDKIESVTYYRIPIARENAPEHADVEQIMELVRAAMPVLRNAAWDTAFVFNCQMGKRRTTTALVMANLIWQRSQINISEIPTDLDTTTGGEAGNFAVIKEVQKRLKFGQQAKWWVDQSIDACAAICNIRSVISEYHELSTAEAKPARRSYYLHRALSFLERYFYLIVFGAYMLEREDHILQDDPSISLHTSTEGQENVSIIQSFSKWLQHHPNLFRLLDDLGGVRYKSEQVLKNCVIKEDHFFGIARIPYALTPNLPNYRRIENEPIFGTAQCREDGLRDVVAHLRGEFDRIVWINLREEAVIYVSGRPFVMRHPANIMENVEYPGIEVDEITIIENQIKQELKSEVRKANGLFMYWYEPREMVSEETMEHINPDAEIKTLNEIYEEVRNETQFDLRYARIPVSDETAPEEKDLDDMVRLLTPAFMSELELERSGGSNNSTLSLPFLSDTKKKQKTAVICNCQMGRGRTTTALVCVYMLRLVLEANVPLPNGGNLLEEICGIRLSGARRQSVAVTGDFVVIRNLVAKLENGEDCKALVDYAIDRCDHMQNLRECIGQCRDLAMDRALPNAKRDFFMLRAVNYLERYFYLICFASYLLEEREHSFQRTLFVAWMNQRYGSALYALLDNLCFEEEIGAEIHVSSMRWRWRRKRKLVSRLE